jgi:L-ectoine synthase
LTTARTGTSRMIVRSLEEIIGTENDVHADNWNSRRFLLKKDGMGFSFNDTIIKAGTETFIWYANHLESVYCIEGEGEIETIDDGKVYQIRPGTMYALDGHEKHYLRARKDMRMMCVFNPPLSGREVHDENGVYPAD